MESGGGRAGSGSSTVRAAVAATAAGVGGGEGWGLRGRRGGERPGPCFLEPWSGGRGRRERPRAGDLPRPGLASGPGAAPTNPRPREERKRRAPGGGGKNKEGDLGRRGRGSEDGESGGWNGGSSRMGDRMEEGSMKRGAGRRSRMEGAEGMDAEGPEGGRREG
ncbi:uncharacterized protein [Petaurus breviceps papuanus]|uniref:uncharacterized protein n=1 Tax=Petaurus breviceps papuanus TaxID=3040969 RepID=UPI0036DD82DF